MPVISQYYSTKNKQPENSNSLIISFGGNSNFVLAIAKVGSFTQDY